MGIIPLHVDPVSGGIQILPLIAVSLPKRTTGKKTSYQESYGVYLAKILEHMGEMKEGTAGFNFL